MEVKEIHSSREVQQFLNLPGAIYQKYPHYVQPLHLHMKMMMGKLNVPQKYFFIVVDNGEAVARMAFKVHHHNGKPMLNFGFFECREGYAAAVPLLINAGRAKHPDLNVMGPFHFRMEDPYVGVLAEGYDREPYFLMPYNPPYYTSYLEAAGLKKVMDLFTYLIEDSSQPLPPLICENAKKSASKGVTIRFLNPKQLEVEARTVARIFNDALRNNWGFEEFLDEQVKEMVTLFKLFIDARVVAFAQYQGKDVGCLLMIPNYNPVIKGSGGRITPALLWRYFKLRNHLQEIRGYALGVLREYHSLGIGSALTFAMFEQGRKIGYHTGEISWILANNGPMNELSKAMGGKHNKIYRVYEISAGTPASLQN
jgi:GNAT superfamily N-acetyltransferase